MVKGMNEMDHDLKEMYEMDYILKKVRWNVIVEVDNVTIEEASLSNFVIMWSKPIAESLSLSLSVNI